MRLDLDRFLCINKLSDEKKEWTWNWVESQDRHKKSGVDHCLSLCPFCSPYQRQCELLLSLGFRHPSSFNFSHFNLLLWNGMAKKTILNWKHLWKVLYKDCLFVSIHYQKWLPEAILVSGWSISKISNTDWVEYYVRDYHNW